MAVTEASDLYIPQVSLTYMRQAFVDSLDIWAKAIGMGPRAPIQLMNFPTIGIEGQYLQGPTFKRISSLVTRRDITSVANTTPVELTGVNNIGVKLHRKIGPIDISRDAARISKATPEEIFAEIGQQAGEQLAVSMQTSILAALRGLVAAMSGTPHTLSVWAAATRTNLSAALLTRGRALMGDKRMNSLSHAIMHSYGVHDLDLEAQGQGFTGVGDRARNSADQGVNRVGFVSAVADDTYLTTSDAGFDKYHTLLCGPGALEVYFHMPLVVYPLDTDLLTEQVIDRWRGDADFTIRAPHSPWDTANGGANPTDASLATSTNWDDGAGNNTYSSHKEVPIVEIVHNSSLN